MWNGRNTMIVFSGVRQQQSYNRIRASNIAVKYEPERHQLNNEFYHTEDHTIRRGGLTKGMRGDIGIAGSPAGAVDDLADSYIGMRS